MSQPPTAGAAATAPVPSAAGAQTPATATTANPAPATQAAPAARAVATPPRDTPRELRRLTTAVIVAGVVFGLAGLATFLLLTVQLQRAEASTDQLIRVQEIQTDLLRADANATNAFLVGGLEPAAQRQTYDDAIVEASQLITEASDAEPADQAALSRLNTLLVDYTGNIELARANNRQGFPVGAQYLRTASSQLRADALPILDNLVEANADRAAGQMNAWIAVVFGVVGLLVLVGFGWSQLWLARRFKRRFNVGMVSATLIGVLTLIVGLVVLGWTAATVGGVRDGSFTDVRDAATARIEGNNAKSNESLTLIARGSGASFEQAWQDSAAAVTDQIDRFADLGKLWQPYADVHAQIRELDDGGQWDRAVALATSDSNTTFNAYDDAVAGLVDSSADGISAGLGSTTPWLIIGAIGSLAAGLVMAVLGRRGLARRLREYR